MGENEMNVPRRRRLIVVATAVAVVAALGAWGLAVRLHDDSGPPATVVESPAPAAGTAAPTAEIPVPAPPVTSGVYGVPTTGAIPTSAPTDVATDEPVDADSPARVVMTYSRWAPATSSIDVNAFIAGVVEDGGTCTVTASGSGGTRAVSSTASADATTTVCGDISLPWAVDAGEATVTVEYVSATTRSISESASVEVDQ